MKLPAVIWTAFASAFVSAAVLLAADQPNILFIMTDDHAAHAISAYGSRINRTRISTVWPPRVCDWTVVLRATLSALRVVPLF